jgi:hypothetical protein
VVEWGRRLSKHHNHHCTSLLEWSESMVALMQLIEQNDVGRDVGAGTQVMLSHRHKDASIPTRPARIRLIQYNLTSNLRMAAVRTRVNLPFMRLVTPFCSGCSWLGRCSVCLQPNGQVGEQEVARCTRLNTDKTRQMVDNDSRSNITCLSCPTPCLPDDGDTACESP